MRAHAPVVVLRKLLIVAVLLSCGETRTGQAPPAVDRESAAACSSTWSPAWQQAAANEWWVEYTVTGGTVQAVWLEVGTRVVNLLPQWGKWHSSTSRLPTGTTVVLHARNSLGEEAQTLPFGYLVATQPATESCAGTCVPNCTQAVCGDDGCGGTCGSCLAGATCEAGWCGPVVPACDGGTCAPPEPTDAGCDGGPCAPPAPTEPGCDGGWCDAGCVAPAWSPTWQQANANNYWVEYTIGPGTVTSARLELAGGATMNLALEWGKWGASTTRISTGAQVVLIATDDAGHTAKTVRFGYLTTPQPVTEQCPGSTPPPLPAPPPAPTGCGSLDAGMVSVVMDDGWAAQYTLARPELRARGMKTTLYLITGRVGQGWADYLTMAQAQTLAAEGNEIAAHTVKHQNLTQLTAAAVDDELRLSKQWLQTNLGVTATDFASPFGAYNDTVVSTAKRYYQTHGTVTTGLNFRGDDLYRLKRENIYHTTTPAQVRTLVQRAQTSRGWLILMFHNFTAGTPGDPYVYRSSDFRTVLDDLRASGVELVTVSQGAARLRCP